MCRTFQLKLLGENQPILIVADTDEDAMAKLKEAKQVTGKKVISFFEVFERKRYEITRNRKTAPSLANVRRLSNKSAEIITQTKNLRN